MCVCVCVNLGGTDYNRYTRYTKHQPEQFHPDIFPMKNLPHPRKFSLTIPGHFPQKFPSQNSLGHFPPWDIPPKCQPSVTARGLLVYYLYHSSGIVSAIVEVVDDTYLKRLPVILKLSHDVPFCQMSSAFCY